MVSPIYMQKWLRRMGQLSNPVFGVSSITIPLSKTLYSCNYYNSMVCTKLHYTLLCADNHVWRVNTHVAVLFIACCVFWRISLRCSLRGGTKAPRCSFDVSFIFTRQNCRTSHTVLCTNYYLICMITLYRTTWPNWSFSSDLILRRCLLMIFTPNTPKTY